MKRPVTEEEIKLFAKGFNENLNSLSVNLLDYGAAIINVMKEDGVHIAVEENWFEQFGKEVVYQKANEICSSENALIEAEKILKKP